MPRRRTNAPHTGNPGAVAGGTSGSGGPRQGSPPPGPPGEPRSAGAGPRNDPGKLAQAEYARLRAEIIQDQKYEFQVPILGIAVSGAILAFAIGRDSPLLCLVPLPILTTAAKLLLALRNSILGIATHMRVFYEGWQDRPGPVTAPCWETALYRFGQRDLRRYGGKYAEHMWAALLLAGAGCIASCAYFSLPYVERLLQWLAAVPASQPSVPRCACVMFCARAVVVVAILLVLTVWVGYDLWKIRELRKRYNNHQQGGDWYDHLCNLKEGRADE